MTKATATAGPWRAVVGATGMVVLATVTARPEGSLWGLVDGNAECTEGRSPTSLVIRDEEYGRE